MGGQAHFGQAFAMATSSNLRLDFSLRGARGVIEAFVTPNHDPVAVGYSLLSGGLPVAFANGFPVVERLSPTRLKATQRSLVGPSWSAPQRSPMPNSR